jgi:hypothetical protein
MKKILFINNGLPKDLSKAFQNESFRLNDVEILNSNFTFNQYADRRLSEIFNEKSYDLILLPYNLDVNNYLAFTGMNVALHIRLTPKWNHCNIPILFIGAESTLEILRLAKHSVLLSTPGVFVTQKRKVDEINQEIEEILKHKPELSSLDYQNFINKIALNPPSFYDNRHSIANEWGMYRLDEIAGTQELKKENNSNFKHLFFKWLEIKFPSKELRSKEIETQEKKYRATLPGLNKKGKIDLSKIK